MQSNRNFRRITWLTSFLPFAERSENTIRTSSLIHSMLLCHRVRYFLCNCDWYQLGYHKTPVFQRSHFVVCEGGRYEYRIMTTLIITECVCMLRNPQYYVSLFVYICGTTKGNHKIWGIYGRFIHFLLQFYEHCNKRIFFYSMVVSYMNCNTVYCHFCFVIFFIVILIYVRAYL